MRISDWSSDVCSSDLGGIGTLVPGETGDPVRRREGPLDEHGVGDGGAAARGVFPLGLGRQAQGTGGAALGRQRVDVVLDQPGDRKRVGSGKEVSVRVDLGGRRRIQKKTRYKEK